MTEIHITADTDTWTGSSTCALNCALAAADAVVVCGFSDARFIDRFEKVGLTAYKCNTGGMFGALNLSRVLRHIPGNEFVVILHSSDSRKTVESALKLVGRPEPMTLIETSQVPFPSVEVSHPADNAEPLLMWLGNITADCGLEPLIERLASMAGKPWRLRVVGDGKAKVVTPILRRCRKLAVDNRIEWVGYSSDPYVQMSGVSLGVVTNGADSVVAREFAAASIPTITNLSDLRL